MTPAQYENVLIRVGLLETAFNDVAVAIKKCATQAQVNELLVLIQQRLAEVEDSNTSILQRITALEREL